ncbi:MAG: hypothetical protein IJU84_07400 [Clostridia bacterium]|nr:hypothetical protein [Clostridia bacterium]
MRINLYEELRRKVGCERIADMAFGNEYNKDAIAAVQHKVLCRGMSESRAHFHSLKQLNELYNYLTGEQAAFSNVADIKNAFMNIEV